MCMVPFLENCSSDVRDRFIESVGESKFAELKLYLVDRSYIHTYHCLSEILAANNEGQDIKIASGHICAKYKSSLGDVFNEKQKEFIIHSLKKDLLI